MVLLSILLLPGPWENHHHARVTVCGALLQSTAFFSPQAMHLSPNLRPPDTEQLLRKPTQTLQTWTPRSFHPRPPTKSDQSLVSMQMQQMQWHRVESESDWQHQVLTRTWVSWGHTSPAWEAHFMSNIPFYLTWQFHSHTFTQVEWKPMFIGLKITKTEKNWGIPLLQNCINTRGTTCYPPPKDTSDW